MIKLSHHAISVYARAFPDDDCGYEELTEGLFSICTADATASVIQPEDETEDAFLDRIERSRKAGRNLFYEEWPKHEYEEGCLY